MDPGKRRVKARGMKAKSLHTRASVKTGGAPKPKKMPSHFPATLSGFPMPHSGGAHGTGPAAPSTRGKTARVHKRSGGARTGKGALGVRGKAGGVRAKGGGRRTGRSSIPKTDQSVSRRDEFIRRGEDALGENTEF